MSANHIEALAKALYENGNPQHTAEYRAILGPFEELDLLQQTIWIDLANAAQNHMDKKMQRLEGAISLLVDRAELLELRAAISRVEELRNRMVMRGSPEATFLLVALKGE